MQSVNWCADVKRNENLHILPQNDLLYILLCDILLKSKVQNMYNMLSLMLEWKGFIYMCVYTLCVRVCIHTFLNFHYETVEG